MPALLEKLKPRISESEIRTAESPLPTDSCPVCGCPYLWQDIYGGPSALWRCVLCDPAPHDSFVARWHRIGSTDAQESEENQFAREWDIYSLTDSMGQQWTVTRRKHTKQPCPAGETLYDWIRKGIPDAKQDANKNGSRALGN